MTKQTLIVACLCLLLGQAVIPAHAQEAVEFRATVPFSFVVLGKTLPAGEYTLTAAPHQIRIRDANRRLVAVALADETQARSAEASGQIIFHCYADRCFFSELRSPGQGSGRQLLMSRAEAALAKEGHAKYFAVLGEKAGK